MEGRRDRRKGLAGGEVMAMTLDLCERWRAEQARCRRAHAAQRLSRDPGPSRSRSRSSSPNSRRSSRVSDPAEQAPLVARSVTPPSPSGRGGTTLLRQRAPRSCTVFVMTPPDEHTSEGGRDDRGVPYHAESTLSSAQVLKALYNVKSLQQTLHQRRRFVPRRM